MLLELLEKLKDKKQEVSIETKSGKTYRGMVLKIKNGVITLEYEGAYGNMRCIFLSCDGIESIEFYPFNI
jgi:hypothetical protein